VRRPHPLRLHEFAQNGVRRPHPLRLTDLDEAWHFWTSMPPS
jgi:hypothetical protein